MADQYREQEVEEVAAGGVVAEGVVETAVAAGVGAELGGMGEPPIPTPAGQEGQAQAGPPRVGAPGAGLPGNGGSATPPLEGFGSSAANPIPPPGPLRPGLMPSPEVLADLRQQSNSMAAVFSYCQVPQDIGMSFMKLAGITDRDHCSLCCTTSREEVEDIFKQMQSESPVPLGARAKIRMAFQVGRVIHGVAEPAAPAPTPTTSASTFPTEVIMKKELATDVVTLGDTVWQTSRAEIRLMTKEMIKKGYARYISVEGDKPPPEENLTPEQLSALELIVRELGSIYADFALWVPFWRRVANSKRFYREGRW